MKFKNTPNYDKFAIAQRYCAENLIIELSKQRLEFDDIFEIGCGSGLLSNLIKSNLKFKNLVLNDIYKTEIMRDENAKIGDFMELELNSKFDLIISSSVFQWISSLENLRDKIYLLCKNGGICAFAMFSKGNLRELSEFTNQSLDYKSKDEICEIFSDKFKIKSVKDGEFRAKFADLKELLNSLKQTGVNNINGKFILNKTSLNALNSHFVEKYGEFSLSYDFVVLICEKE